MKKAICVLLVTCFLIMSGASVTTATTSDIEINYLADRLFIINGDITLIFDSTTAESKNDTTLTKMFYSPSEDATVYQVVSNEITYDWTFVNNTRYFYYSIFENTTDIGTYIIAVDYSSIVVPESWVDILNATVAEKDLIIAGLIVKTEKQQDEIDSLNQTIKDLISEINIWKLTVDTFKDQRDSASENLSIAISELNDSKAEVLNLKDRIKTRDSVISDQNEDIDHLENILNSLQWGFYDEYRGVSVYFFNFPSFIVGIVLFILLLLFFIKKVGLNRLSFIEDMLRRKTPSDEKKDVLNKKYDTNANKIMEVEQKLMSGGVTKMEKKPKKKKRKLPEKMRLFNEFISKRKKEGILRDDAIKEWNEQKELVKK